MDKNMKIAVCDSDKDFLNKVEVILQKLSKNNEVPYITFKYENSYVSAKYCYVTHELRSWEMGRPTRSGAGNGTREIVSN